MKPILVWPSQGGYSWRPGWPGTVADHLVVLGFQQVEPRIGHAVKSISLKAQGLFIAPAKNHHAVHMVIRYEAERIGVVNVNAGKGVL